MTAISPEQREALLARREEAALSELEELGAFVTLHEQRRFVEGDELRGIDEGWRAGTCAAVIYSTEGKRRNFVGVSAVEVLDRLTGFLKAQERLTESAPNRFVVSKEFVPATQVVHREGSETAARKRHDIRRELEFDPTGALIGVTDTSRLGG